MIHLKGTLEEDTADVLAQTFGDPRFYIDGGSTGPSGRVGGIGPVGVPVVEKDVKVVIADEAKNIVAGARRSAYGKPEQNFERIARFWQAYFRNRDVVMKSEATGQPFQITAADVSPLMRLMKEARLCETPDHRDSFVDLIGYTLTGAEVNGVKP